MKKAFAITLICLFVFFDLLSQITSYYVPLEFKNATPVWHHLSVDSTIIGYQNSSVPNPSFDGTSHLIYSHQGIPPTIEDGYLYLSMRAQIDGGAGGGLIEKINLKTGVSVWKDVFDKRTNIDRDVPVLTRIAGDTLLVFGYRSLPGANAVSYMFSGKLFIKKYNKHTGALFEEYYADETQTDNHKFSSIDFLEFDSRKRVLRSYGQYGGFIGKEGLMVRKTINLSGQIETIDTLRGAISHLSASLDSFVDRKSSFWTHNDQMYFVETYAPVDNGLVQSENHAALSKYNENGDLIYSKKIPNTLLDSFEFLFINNISDEFIVLGGYNDRARREQFFLILDQDANFVKKINSLFEGESLNLRVCPAQNSAQEMLFFQNKYDYSAKQGRIRTFKANEDGQLILLKEIEADIESYAAKFSQGLYLENGDILLHIEHSYIVDPDTFPKGYFKNWFRFAPEEIGLPPNMVPTQAVIDARLFEIYPNPAINEVVISTKTSPKETFVLTVFDVLGNLVLSQKLDSKETVLDVSSLESGTYFVSLDGYQTRRYGVSKFVKL